MERIRDYRSQYYIWSGVIDWKSQIYHLRSAFYPIIIPKRLADRQGYIEGINTLELLTFNLSEPKFYNFFPQAQVHKDDPLPTDLSGIYYPVTLLD